MRQSGKICLYLLMLLFSRIAASGEIVEYSMYDEFGPIMFSGPGQLVKNGRYTAYQTDNQADQTMPYRYRWGESAEYGHSQGFAPGRRGQQQQVWKFRPRDEKKEKKIIKIEDPEVLPVFRYPQRRSPMLNPPGVFIPYLP